MQFPLNDQFSLWDFHVLVQLYCFNLLASDPNRRFAKNWQAFSPTLAEKQAKVAVWAGMNATTKMVPGLKKVHEMSVDHPEECLVFMQPSVINFLHLVFNLLPNFYNYYKNLILR